MITILDTSCFQTTVVKLDKNNILKLFSLKNPHNSLEILTKCLQDVSFWMSSRRLKLNPDKTDFLLMGSKVQREQFVKCFPTRLLAQEVTPSPSARNIGIVFDSALNFNIYLVYLTLATIIYVTCVE